MQPVWSLSKYLNSWSMRSGVPSLNSSAYTCRNIPERVLKTEYRQNCLQKLNLDEAFQASGVAGVPPLTIFASTCQHAPVSTVSRILS